MAGELGTGTLGSGELGSPEEAAGALLSAYTALAKPSLDLTIEVEGLHGERYRLTPDAPAERRYQGLSFATQRGEGFSAADYQLTRPIYRDYSDVAILGTQRFLGENGDVAYEGLLHSNPRNSEGQTLAMSLVGFAFLLKASQISPLIIDRRLAPWGASSTERLAALAAASISLLGSFEARPNNYVYKLIARYPFYEKVGIGACLVDDFTNVETKPAPITEAGELVYFSGPEDIAELRYDFRSMVGAEEAAWQNDVAFGRDSAFATSPITGTDHNAKDALLQKKAVGATGYRYVRIRDWLNAASEGAKLARIFAWGNVRVIGSHPLTQRGSEPDEGYWLSEVIAYILSFYPQIAWAGQRNTFPVAQAAYHDNPQSGYDIISALNELALWETNVYDGASGPAFYYQPADLTKFDWVVRSDQPGVTVDFQGDTIEEFANAIVVTYTDFQGQKQVLYPQPYPQLQDASETNPANQRGIRLWTSTEVPWPCNEEEALQFGRIKLAEYNRPKRQGTITVQGHIEDAEGNWHPGWAVRASDTIGVLNRPDEEPRLIHATSWDDDTKTLTVNVDGLPQDLDAVIARHEIAFQARNL